MRLKFLFSYPLTLDCCLQEKSKDEKPVTDSWMELTKTVLGGDPYQSSEDDSLYLVAPGVENRGEMGYYFFSSLLKPTPAACNVYMSPCVLRFVACVACEYLRDDVRCFP